MRYARELLRMLRRTVRGLRRSPVFTTAVVLSLALGVGANTAVFALLYQSVLRPLPYPNARDLVVVGASTPDGKSWEIANYNFASWSDASRTLSAISWVRDGAATRFGAESQDLVQGARAGSDLLEVLGIRPALGRWFSRDEELRLEPVVVLSYSLWQTRFGADTAIIGRASIRFDDRSFTIIGVLPPGAGYPSDASFWYPYPENQSVQVIARARSGVSVAEIEHELNRLAAGIELNKSLGIAMTITVAELHERLFGASEPILRLLLWTAVLLLLLTCANVGNLSLARTLERRHELAIRLALGSTRFGLAGHLLAENAVLAAAGGIAGIVVALWATGLLVRFSPPDLAVVRGATVAPRVLLHTVGISVAVAFLVSAAPVIALNRGHIGAAIGQLKESGLGRAAPRVRTLLVVAQLSIALLLLVATGLLIRSMGRLTSIDTGFDRRNLVFAHVRFSAGMLHDTVRQRVVLADLTSRIHALGGVRAVALGPPPLIGRSGPSFTEGYSNILPYRDSTQAGAPLRNIWVKYVGPQYLETFKIPVREGRDIQVTDDENAPAVALINESAARLLFQGHSAIGRRLHGFSARKDGNRLTTVVGIVPDVRQRDITIPAYPEVWLPAAQQGPGSEVYLTARTRGDPKALLRQMQRLVADYQPALLARRISTMEATVREALAPQRYVLVAIGAFALLALTLSALGLYAVVSYVTGTRIREMGVRMALGASTHELLWMVLRDAIRQAGIGTMIGMPLAIACSRIMARFLYEVGPLDPSVYLTAPTLLAFASVIAAYAPARRATRVNPVRALQPD